MSKKEDQAFATWADEFKKSLPDDESRAHFEALLDHDVTRDELYRGTLREKDYYTKLNELSVMQKELEAATEELNSWYEEESPKYDALVAERDALKAQLKERGNEGAPPPQAGIPGFSTEDFAAVKAKAERIEAIDKILPAVIADMGKIALDAARNDFEYDPHEVMRDTLSKGLTPWMAYQGLTAEQREQRYEKDKEAERAKWIEEGKRQAFAAKTGSPDAMPAAGPLWENLAKDGEQKESTQADRVNAALKDLMEGNV